MKISKSVKRDISFNKTIRSTALFADMMEDESLDPIMTYLIFDKLKEDLNLDEEIINRSTPLWVRAKAQLLKKQKNYF